MKSLDRHIALLQHDSREVHKKLQEKNEEIERLNNNIKEVLEYLDNSNISWIDKNEIVVRLKGDE